MILEQKWRIELLNGLSAHQGAQVLQRFRTQKTGELLAFLAINLQRAISREELAETIWPESEREAARSSLRTALASLRHQLEPPGTPANSVLYTDRATARLQPEFVTTDVHAFEAACRTEAAAPAGERLQSGLEAVRLYSGDLLPGCYADWVFPQREKLSQSYQALLRNVVSGLWKNGEKERALEYARRLIAADPLREEAYILTMRLYAAAGRPTDALRCFLNWKRLLAEEFGESPSPAAQALAQQISEASGKPIEKSASLLRQAEVAAAAADNPTEPPPLTRKSQELPQAVDTEAQPLVRLPLTLTHFFGRETEIQELSRRLIPESSSRLSYAAQRLITLTGPGGTGKTRLAIEVAKRIAQQARHSVTFVPLSEIRSPERLMESLANVLVLPPNAQTPLLDQIVSTLFEGPHLLVLDNFEQLLSPLETEDEHDPDSAALTIHNLLERVPTLQCLVTSRQCLEIEGEQEYPLHPLSTPAHAGTPERLLEFASVQLFVDRAQIARPDFQLTPRNAEIVGNLCSRLEGLPLAIELAAAWSSVLSPAQILERLSQRFDLLVSRRKGRLSRHQTLHAAIEWSYKLLPPDMQTFFLRLSVFRNGWTVEAAEAICQVETGKRVGIGSALDTLQALRDRSLVTVEENEVGGAEVLRFRMLESLREFAAAQIPQEETLALHRAHRRWCIALAREGAGQLNGAGQSACLQRLDLERENFRAALHWSLEDPEGGPSGLKLLGELTHYWRIRGNYAEVRFLADRMLSRPDAQEPTEGRAATLMAASIMAVILKDPEAAIRYQEESLQIARSLGDPYRLGATLFNMGNAMISVGNVETARRYYEESLHHYQNADKEIGVASVYGALAYLAGRSEDFPAAIHYDLQALQIFRKLNHPTSIAHYARHLGIIYAMSGQSDQARECFFESLNEYEGLKDVHGLADMLRNLAHLMPMTEASVRLMGAAQALNATLAAPPLHFDGDMERAQAVLGHDNFETAWRQGSLLTVDQAAEEARALLARNLPLVMPEFRHA